MEKKQLVVLLVSDQTIPNIQFSKWVKHSFPDQKFDFLFISTQKMEELGKSRIICNIVHSFGFKEDKYYIVEVEENNFSEIPKELEKIEHSNKIDYFKYEKIIVNITGGTKLVSLSSFQFFIQKKAEIYYLPIFGQLQQIYPNTIFYDNLPIITIEECMKANGYEYEANSSCLKDFEFNLSFYKNCISKYNSGLKIINNMATAEKNDDGSFNILSSENSKKSEIDDANEILRYCSFDPTHLSKNEIKYIMGGWLEEFVYQWIKKNYNLPDSAIALNVRSKSIVQNVKNEFDVVFMDNQHLLHIVECKAWSKDNNYDSMLDAIYKLQAEKSKFGLKSKCHLFTTAKASNNIQERAEQYGIDIINVK